MQLLFQELPVRNTLDIMHIKRNVSDNVVKHFFGKKDTLATRQDMRDVSSMPHLHLQARPGGSFVKPKAAYTFSKSEKVNFMKTVSTTKVSTGHSSTLVKHIWAKKFAGLKSDDHHVLLQQILLTACRNLLERGVCGNIIRLGNLFERICAKVIRVSSILVLKTYGAETLCLLEMHFPPRFFDIMTHLVIHLVKELEVCGPVHAQWCYCVERYLGVLTKYVLDKSKPEAGMAIVYMVKESLGFCKEYFALYPHTRRRVWDPEEEMRDAGEVLLGKGLPKRFSHEALLNAHDYVIRHSVHTQELLRCV